MNNVYTITGKNNKSYSAEIYPIGHEFKESDKGVYIFYRVNNKHKIVYIGQSGNLYERICSDFKNHQSYKCIMNNAPTHIGIIYTPNKNERLVIETDLRGTHHCPCNLQ